MRGGWFQQGREQGPDDKWPFDWQMWGLIALLVVVAYVVIASV